MLPTKCFEAALRSNPSGSAEPDISDFGSICRGAAVASKDQECRGVTAQQQRYSCSFKSLSSFWQVGSENWSIVLLLSLNAGVTLFRVAAAQEPQQLLAGGQEELHVCSVLTKQLHCPAKQLHCATCKVHIAVLFLCCVLSTSCKGLNRCPVLVLCAQYKLQRYLNVLGLLQTCTTPNRQCT
jgi:hypothetical protein